MLVVSISTEVEKIKIYSIITTTMEMIKLLPVLMIPAHIDCNKQLNDLYTCCLIKLVMPFGSFNQYTENKKTIC